MNFVVAKKKKNMKKSQARAHKGASVFIIEFTIRYHFFARPTSRFNSRGRNLYAAHI